jgi:hypothetical protein
MDRKKKTDGKKTGNSDHRHPETQIPSSPRRQMHAGWCVNLPRHHPATMHRCVVKLTNDADLSHVLLLESHPVRHGQQLSIQSSIASISMTIQDIPEQVEEVS